MAVDQPEILRRKRTDYVGKLRIVSKPIFITSITVYFTDYSDRIPMVLRKSLNLGTLNSRSGKSLKIIGDLPLADALSTNLAKHVNLRLCD